MPLGGAAGAFAPELVKGRQERDERLERVLDLQQVRVRPSLADLLRPERAAVDFVGRSAELRELTRWAEDAQGGPLCLMVGPGGVGKSRLTVEFAARMSGRGWSVHWVRDGQEARALSVTRAVVRRKPLLLVVDYAETRGGLAGLLHEIAVALDVGDARAERAGGGSGRVRVLLIARVDGEWWQRLATGEAAVREVVRRAGILRVEAELGAGLSPDELVARAVARFAELLGTVVPADWRVEVPQGARVLVLHAAALVVALGSGGSQAGAQAQTDPVRLVAEIGVLDKLIEHESRLWLHSVPEPLAATGERGARRIVTAAALFSLPDERQAVAVLSRVPELADPWRAMIAARWVRELYPPEGPGLWCGALGPDLLAERIVVRTLFESAGVAAALFAGAGAEQAAEGLTILTRAGQHHEDAETLIEEVVSADPSRMAGPAVTVAVETGGAIGRVLARVLARAPLGARELDRIAQAMPFPSLALADAAAVVAGRAIEALPRDTDPAERARRLHQWSKVFYQAGDPGRAAAVQIEAVDLLRRLDQDEPGAHRSLLASALNNLGVWYSATGELDKALDASEAAVEIRRALADADTSELHPLAQALVNLAVRFSHRGEPDRSLEPAKEAAEILTALDEREPGRYRPDLATAWGNYGELLSEAGADEDAVAATARALALRRALAAADPDRHRPALLTSLLNYGAQCSKAGREREAVIAGCEAVALALRIADSGQGTIIVSIAMALSNLADLIEDSAVPGGLETELAALPARLRDPLALTEEAARAWHRLSEQEMVAYRRRAAFTMGRLATRLAAAGRPAEAEQARAEAAQLVQDATAR
jgi:tetratricopeptide (TPR) repeat protein